MNMKGLKKFQQGSEPMILEKMDRICHSTSGLRSWIEKIGEDPRLVKWFRKIAKYYPKFVVFLVVNASLSARVVPALHLPFPLQYTMGVICFRRAG